MKTRRSGPARPRKRGIRVLPREFVFVDRKTGRKRFTVKPAADGNPPLEETSSLLAMHCVLRSQKPADFRVMVAIDKGLMDRIVPRTRRLIDACSPELMPIRITARQQQVLRGIFQNLRNKEIAAAMNVAERTVKFHVAALLEKFQVATRVDLTEKVSDLISAGALPNRPFPRQFPVRPVHAPESAGKPTLVRIAPAARRA